MDRIYCQICPKVPQVQDSIIPHPHLNNFHPVGIKDLCPVLVVSEGALVIIKKVFCDKWHNNEVDFLPMIL